MHARYAAVMPNNAPASNDSEEATSGEGRNRDDQVSESDGRTTNSSEEEDIQIHPQSTSSSASSDEESDENWESLEYVR